VPRSRPTALSTSTRLYAAAAWTWADGRVQSCGDSIRYDSAQCTIACNVHLIGGGGRWIDIYNIYIIIYDYIYIIVDIAYCI